MGLFDELRPPYSTIVVDPPWHYEGRVIGGGEGRTARQAPMPFSTLGVDEISAIPVSDLAAPGAYLFLWTTQRYVWDARIVAERWGWRPLELLTWCKTPQGLGPGGTFSSTTEFILFCRRPVGALIQAARATAGLSQGQLETRARGTATRMLKRWEDGDCYPTPAQWDQLRRYLDLPSGMTSPPNRHPSTWWRWDRGAHSEKPAPFLDIVEQVSPGPYVELFARQPRLGWDAWGFGHEMAA